MGGRVTRVQSEELARARRLKQALDSGAAPAYVSAENDWQHAFLSWKNPENIETRYQYLEQFFQNAPDGLSIVDAERRVICVNDAFESMFGYSSQEALGQSIDQLIGVPEREAEAQWIAECVARKEKITIETQRRNKDGSPVEVSLSSAPIGDDGKPLATGTVYRDISRRKRALEMGIHQGVPMTSEEGMRRCADQVDCGYENRDSDSFCRACALPLLYTALIGRYVVEALLSKGGYAAVFRGVAQHCG